MASFRGSLGNGGHTRGCAIEASSGVLALFAQRRWRRGAEERRGCRRLAAVAMSDAVEESKLPTASCVKIWASGASPSYLLPWQVGQQEEWTGSGFALLVDGKWRLLTNAHVVDSALVVRVSQQSNSGKVEAKVLAIAHDLDLALLDIDDADFRDAIPPVELGEGLPPLFREVEAIGYPEGGTTICVTKGVVSRVDSQLYAHASAKGIYEWAFNNPGKLLIVQIDAAINAGNSGGPAVDKDGKVLGVASSGMDAAQSIGYIIPTCLVQVFLDEVVTTGAWAGVQEPGIKYRCLESKPLREFLKLPKGKTGVQLTSVAPQGALAKHAKRGDVLMTIDSQDISNEGTILLNLASGQEIQVPFEQLITSKPKGVPTTLSMLQAGSAVEETVTVTFGPISPLLPRFHGYDTKPSYFIVGGLVFMQLSTPLLRELPVPAPVSARLEQWRRDREEVIVLMRVLSHSINEGIQSNVRILSEVNGESIHSMDQLVRVTMAAISESRECADGSAFLCFGFLRAGRKAADMSVSEMLKPSDVLSSDEDILFQHQIPAPVSGDLEDAYKAHAPSDVACVRGWLRYLAENKLHESES